MFIWDDEILERWGADALALLDTEPATQKDKATRPPGARFRPAVEKALTEMAQR